MSTRSELASKRPRIVDAKQQQVRMQIVSLVLEQRLVHQPDGSMHTHIAYAGARMCHAGTVYTLLSHAFAWLV